MKKGLKLILSGTLLVLVGITIMTTYFGWPEVWRVHVGGITCLLGLAVMNEARRR